MLFITTYRVKPYITKEETAELMTVFGKNGAAPGDLAHYVYADGGGGVVLSESDDFMAGYRNNLDYSAWLDLDTRVIIKVDDAVPHILDALK